MARLKIISSTDPKLTQKECNWVEADVQGHLECLKCGDWIETDITDITPKCQTQTTLLPQPSQALIKAYCEQGGFDEVDVEYEEEGRFAYEGDTRYTLKVDPIHNTITTHRIVEKMYSREEMIELCKKAFAQGEKGEGCTALYKSFDEWIEENL
tara:strand:- start:185 stop:646 length:462 start_codon:yes stop_codon:yes gene_type:complete